MENKHEIVEVVTSDLDGINGWIAYEGEGWGSISDDSVGGNFYRYTYMARKLCEIAYGMFCSSEREKNRSMGQGSIQMIALE